MSKIQIVLNGHEDKKSITDALNDLGKYEIEVVDNYNFGGSDIYTIDLINLSPNELDNFCDVLNLATYPIEADALIWKIKRSGKSFNLNSSFIRNGVNGGDQISDGTQLKMRVEIPGFETNQYREIDIFKSKEFNPADLDLLREIGISINGNGGDFQIDNEMVCKVFFKMPTGATDVYIIDDVDANLVIPV